MKRNGLVRRARPGVLLGAPSAILALAIWAGPLWAAPLAGAIFTTTPDGGIVNENTHYLDKREVYLDGGPGPHAPQTAAGLPNGVYVFQVTNPSGQVLLSEDPSKCRVVEVTDGVIVRLVPPAELELSATYEVGNGANAVTYPCHVQDAPDGEAGASGRHDTNTDLDHGPPAIVVQLMPFYDTPNPGGVYKAWMMPLARYLAKGGDLGAVPRQQKDRGRMIGYVPDPGFRPPRDETKTDNFKVRQAPPALTVRKFHDRNGNGLWDEGEPEIGVDECVDGDGFLTACPPGGGWLVTITEPLWDGDHATMDRFTPVVEEVVIGQITVEEALYEAPGWMISHLSVDGEAQAPVALLDVTFSSPGETHEVVFGNYLPGRLCGSKFLDRNGNGVRDEGEPGLAGVSIHLSGLDGKGAEVALDTVTDAEGRFCFVDLAPGAYSVTETGWPAGFVPSTAISAGPFSVASGGQVELGWVFGNLQPVALCGAKFEDLDANGVLDEAEPGLAGVTVTLSGVDGRGYPVSQSTTTAPGGGFCFTELWPGSYSVAETVPEGYHPSTATASGPHALPSGMTLDLGWIFGNYRLVSLCGRKFEDLDANGVHGPYEPGLEGVTILLTGTDGLGAAVTAETITNAEGSFCFVGLLPGSYTVTEVVPEGYLPSTDLSAGPEQLESGDALSLGWIFGNFRPVDIEAHKFFDANGNGLPDPCEESLSGITICLTDAAGAPVTHDAFGNSVTACQVTGEAGMVAWTGLMPGTYEVTEMLPAGFLATTPVQVMLTLASGENASLEFGNVAHCDGLTPGYWKNWRNHYTQTQLQALLVGTIAATPAELDAIFAEYNSSEGMEMTILRAMLLANQLTLNLTFNARLPNPSGGSLFLVCQVPGVPGDLADWLEKAVAMHEADGVGFSRHEILWVKSVLDAFANLNTSP